MYSCGDRVEADNAAIEGWVELEFIVLRTSMSSAKIASW